MECFARRYEAFVQVPGKRCSIPPDGLEAPQPAHPVSGLSVNTEGRLIFEVEGDRAENLSQCQSLKFGQDRFRGETFIEALDYGIERYTSTGQVAAAVTLFDVFFRHQPNYSGNLFSLAHSRVRHLHHNYRCAQYRSRAWTVRPFGLTLSCSLRNSEIRTGTSET